MLKHLRIQFTVAFSLLAVPKYNFVNICSTDQKNFWGGASPSPSGGRGTPPHIPPLGAFGASILAPAAPRPPPHLCSCKLTLKKL